jgi:drug/metabolite transporter, DME family
MNHQTQRPSDLLLVAAAALLWGTIGVAVGIIYRVAETNALSIGLIRLLIAAPAMFGLALLLNGAAALRLRRPHLGWILTMGVANGAYQIAYFSAIPRLGVATAVLLNICSAPLFASLLARILLKEKLHRSSLPALALAIGGTWLLIGDPLAQLQQLLGDAAATPLSMPDLVGVLLALSAGFCYSVVIVGSRRLANDYVALIPSAYSSLIGGLVLVPFAAAAGLVLSYPPSGWAALVFLALVPTALSYWLYVRGMRSVRAGTAATISLLEPLGSALLAVLMLGEQLAPPALLGAALLIAGIVLISRNPHRPQDGATQQA